jgi:hypothetical protein
MSSGFKLGQFCEGEGLRFEVINLEPLKVRCLENSGWWSQYNKGLDETKYATWQVGEEYELYLGNSSIGNFNFKNYGLPWCSLYENGKVAHYR